MNPTALAEKLPARRGEYRGAETVTAYSDPRTEFAALVSSCGIYDLGWRAKISLSGKDRVRWLNGMISNNIRDLAAGHGVYAFLLNPQGHILADLYAYNRGESILLDTDQSQAAQLEQLLKRYIIMDKVELANISDKLTAIGIAGPKASEVLHSAITVEAPGVQPGESANGAEAASSRGGTGSSSCFEIPQLAPLQTADISCRGSQITLVRKESALFGNASSDSYEIWLAPEHLNRIWDALLQAHATPVGSEALELYRIATGIPRYGQDIRERDLPQETEQNHALSFTKGCYIGQEIVERIRSRGAVHRKFTGFLIEGPPPTPGTRLQLEGRDIGEITSSASLPTQKGERAVALGYVRREVGAPGKLLHAGAAKATVAEPPFQIFD